MEQGASLKILIVTDAWEPQVNGVVRTLKMTTRHLQAMGHDTHILSPQDFRSVPCPTYPEISLALATRAVVARRIDAVAPDCLHIATEGPLGWAARAVALRRGWPFTTAYHSRFPEYVHARVRVPVGWSYALLRRFHNAGRATLAPTPAIVDDLKARGFTQATLVARREPGSLHTRRAAAAARQRAGVPHVGRLAVEKQVHKFLECDLPGEKWVAGAGAGRGPIEGPLSRRALVRGAGRGAGAGLPQRRRDGVPQRDRHLLGLVMVEAMACGTPVAAYPVPGPIDVVGHDSPGGAIDDNLRAACWPRWPGRARACAATPSSSTGRTPPGNSSRRWCRWRVGAILAKAMAERASLPIS